jgi:ribonucleotide monophosphatase NagD (HAD superfamily)
MRRVEGLKELAGDYGALLCDVWGVLHNGIAAFPAAVDAIARVRAAAGPVVLVTSLGEHVLHRLGAQYRVSVHGDDGIVAARCRPPGSARPFSTARA